MHNLTEFFSTCVHEAAHAVMHHRAGVTPEFIEVATQSGLTLKNRKVEGICKGGAGLPIQFGFPYFEWDPELDTYRINHTIFQEHYSRGTDETNAINEKITHDNIIILMSGRMAEEILLGEPELDWRAYDSEGDDFTLAEVMCTLLYKDNAGDEYMKLFAQTEKLLRVPKTWKRIIVIAEVLKKSFRIEGEELKTLLR